MLVGMGGVGKTSLARAFAQRHLADYGIVWWVRAEDPSAIDAEFRALLEILLPPGEAAQVGNARTAAFALLAKQTDPWLLVLDNVPDAGSAQGLLPPAGNGHVLITTRASTWPRPTTVQPLNTDAGVELLTTQSGDLDRAAAETLAIELGGLPLALTQAAGFVRANVLDLATYLRLYRDRSAELHKEGQPADYPHTVATTWQLAMDRLTRPAREMLNLLVFYAPDAIPVDLLFSGKDELATHRAIGELHAYSLVIPTGPNMVSMHRLVQSVTGEQLGSQIHEWADRAHELISVAMPKPPATAITLADWNALRTHVHELLDHLPPDDPDTMSTMDRVAFWTWESGDAVRTRDLYAQLLAAQERVFGAEHPDTLNVRHNIAVLSGATHGAARARELLAELLPINLRVVGPRHMLTLSNRNTLAWWTGAAGDPTRARDLLAELVPTVEEVFGPDHPDSLKTRHNLAYWTGEAGNAARARDLFAELLVMRERTLGIEHPHALGTRNDLAYWKAQAGDPAGARELLAELLPIRERVMGSEHPDTLTTRHNLAHWTGHAGGAAAARDLFTQLLSTRERVLGVGHPDTVRSREELAYWAELAGAVEEEGPGGGGEG